MIVLTFLHLQLGVQAIIEDYVRDEGMKTASILLCKGVCFALALLCIVSVTKVGLTRPRSQNADAYTTLHSEIDYLHG
jgi:hypothetical protein